MTKINKALSLSDYELIENLANIIWNEHYVAIIGINQVEYMLEKFQSVKAITNQIKNGYEYFLITYETKAVGYISVKKEKNTLFLSKIYMLSQYQGKKIGKTALLFVETKARTNNLAKVTLTVNRGNSDSIKVYEKIGYHKAGTINIDIGHGYVMDDYKMEKNLKN
jgi:ribosomal protein S18 acetylase RimI-like enzyme